MQTIPTAGVKSPSSLRWRSLTWLGLARGLVALLALAILAATLVSLFNYQDFALHNLDNKAINTPNDAWTPEQTQAALKELGWPATTVAWWGFARDLVGLLLVYPVLILLLWRGAGGWFGIYVAFTFTLMGTVGGTFLQPLMAEFPALKSLDHLLGTLSWQLYFLIFFFFPNGQPAPRWVRWLAGAWIAWMVIQSPLLAEGIQLLGPAVENRLSGISSGLAIGFVLSALASQFYRYFRVSNTLERQQTKLVVLVLLFMLAIVAAIPFAFRPANTLHLAQDLIAALIQWTFFGLALMLVPLAIGVSILRYRLWDVDVIVRRTLVYAALTGILALVFFGGVTLLQGILTSVSGQQSSLAVALSTLAIAALFNPLRRRIQEFIDRRFYRRKYDAEQALAEFATTARNETDLECLTGKLTGAVQDTLQPSHLSLWLKPAGEGGRGTYPGTGNRPEGA